MPEAAEEFIEEYGLERRYGAFMNDGGNIGVVQESDWDETDVSEIDTKPDFVDPIPSRSELFSVETEGEEQFFRRDWITNGVEAFGEDALRVRIDETPFMCKFIIEEDWAYLVAPHIKVKESV